MITIEKIVYYSYSQEEGVNHVTEGVEWGGGTHVEAPGSFKRQREREALLTRAFIMVSTGI